MFVGMQNVVKVSLTVLKHVVSLLLLLWCLICLIRLVQVLKLISYVLVTLQAWNIHTCAEHSLTGPVGQVYAMIVGKDTLFAGAQVTTLIAISTFSLFFCTNVHRTSVATSASSLSRFYIYRINYSMKTQKQTREVKENLLKSIVLREICMHS